MLARSGAASAHTRWALGRAAATLLAGSSIAVSLTVSASSAGPRRRLRHAAVPPAPQRAAAAELPGGGSQIFDGKTYVALYGHPGTGALGVLGEQGTQATIRRAQRMAAQVPAEHRPPGRAGAGGDRHRRLPVGGCGRRLLGRVVGREAPTAGGCGRARGRLRRSRPAAGPLHLPQPGQAVSGPPRRAARRAGTRPRMAAQERAAAPRADRLGAGRRDQRRDRLARRPHPRRRAPAEDAAAAPVPHVHDHQPVVPGHLALGGRARHPDGRPRVATGEALHLAGTSPGAPDGIVFGWKNFIDEDRPMLGPKATMAISPEPRWVSFQ